MDVLVQQRMQYRRAQSRGGANDLAAAEALMRATAYTPLSLSVQVERPSFDSATTPSLLIRSRDGSISPPAVSSGPEQEETVSVSSTRPNGPTPRSHDDSSSPLSLLPELHGSISSNSVAHDLRHSHSRKPVSNLHH